MIKLINIAKPFLSESPQLFTEMFDFQNIESFDYTKTCSSDSSKGRFKTDNGETVDMFSTKFPFSFGGYTKDLPDSFNQTNETNIYDLAFVIDGMPGQARKSTLKEFLPIIKTVFMWIRDDAIPCIEKSVAGSRGAHPIFQVSTQSKDNNFSPGGDRQKKIIYKYLLTKYLPSNYQLTSAHSEKFSKDTFMFQKK